MKTYDEFRAYFEKTHAASVPVLQQIQSEYPRWLKAIVLAMFISAALLSGVHTVPTVRAGMQNEMVAPLVADVVALLAFVAIELAIFASAYALVAGWSWVVAGVLSVTFVVALVANVQSVLQAFSVIGANGWTQFVAVILGVGAPLITLMAGKMFVSMHRAEKQTSQQASDDYREAMIIFDRIVNREYEKYVRQQTDNQTTSHVSSPVLSVQTDSRQTARAAFGYNRTSDGQQRVIEHLSKHPEDAALPLRRLAEIIGVNKDTVNAGRKAWQAQLGAAPELTEYSSNGHGQS